jgi:hypothetical protein
MCGAACAVLAQDHDHCGDCDTVCAADETCVSGACLVLNNSCATGFIVTGDVMITDEAIADGGAVPTGANCGFGSGDQALYYAVTIPAGQEVAVTTSSSGDLVLFEQAACGMTCVRASDYPESLTLSNPGASDMTRIVGVRTYSSSTTSSTTYDIQFTYSTPTFAANAACATATSITADTSITAEDIAEGGPRPSGTGCGSGSGSKALYYSVTIPAGQQVAVTTSSSADLVLFEEAVCGAAACLQSSDTPESLTLTNLGTSAITTIVGVRMYSASTGTFDIAFAYSTP